MRFTKTTLFAGSALALIPAAIPAGAFAQSAGDPAPATAPAAASATADPMAAQDDAPAEGTGGDIVVLGFGQSRQVQTVTAVDIERLVPGTSPLKAIQKLPGVNFQAADPFGAYEWAVRISLRGFNQNQLGFTLDGIPLGDMSYGNVNGLHVSRAIISENVARTDVAQGAGAVGTASTSNLGGTIQFFSADPTDTPNATGSATYGSNDTWRGFARLDTGLIGDVFKGYVSYAQYQTDKWKGFGEQRQKQVNAKIMADLGAQGSMSLFFDYSQRREQDYQDLSNDIIARRGLNNDNITNNYPLAEQLARVFQNQSARSAYAAANGGSTAGFTAPYAGAGFVFPAGFGTVDDSYFDAAGLRDDYLAGFNVTADLLPGLTLKSTSYYHVNKGQGSWILPYNPTPAGAPNAGGTPITNPSAMSFRTTEYRMNRGGEVASLSYDAGPNTLMLTGWYESNDLDVARRFYGMTAGTQNRDAMEFQANPFFTQWDGNYDTRTLQYSVSDALRLFDGRLTINGGWKGLRVLSSGRLRTGALGQGDLESKDWFLPQAGVVFGVGGGAEIFASYTQNMRAFVASAAAAPYSGSAEAFNAIKDTVKPETSKTAEGGLRYRQPGFQTSAVGYYVDFSNRLLSFTNGVGSQGNIPTLNNAGSVRNYGAEFSVNYRPLPPVSLFASYSYNRSTYRNDVVNGAGVVLAAIRGKTVVDSPEHMVKGEIVVEQSGFTGRVGADYMSKRYFTYTNDQSVPGRVIFDASIGYSFRGDGFLHGFGIEGSVTNLTDKKYIATIGSNGYVNSGDNQTLLSGAPRQFFVSLKKGF
jgi:iron complex outermembrane receptor protein